MANLKWPIEYLCSGFRPLYNTNATNPNQYRDWHRLSKLDDHYLDSSAKFSSKVAVDALTGIDAVTSVTVVSQAPVEKVTYPVSSPTVDTVRIVAHGIDIYADTKAAFFNEYMPFTFGGANILTPKDSGALLINFCLYPGTYQPSGHINVSRAREFHFHYESSFVSSANNAELIVVASAINFLLISDGSAVLRYST
ncbi:MAG: major capsid protein [Castellaniella sp.]